MKICRCFNGLDSCDQLATCQPVPAAPAAPVVDTRTDCEKCRACIAVVSEKVTAAANAQQINDSVSLASTFMQQCMTNFTVGNVFLCKGISNAIATSYRGNLAKRAGALCTRLGQCSGDAATAKCNISDSARLDLCAQDGLVGGASIVVPTAGM